MDSRITLTAQMGRDPSRLELSHFSSVEIKKVKVVAQERPRINRF